MLPTLRQRKIARVLFDESHGEAWSVRPEVAAAIQPEHPAASSYAAAAAALADRDYEVAALTAAPLSRAVLAGADVLRHRPSLRSALGAHGGRFACAVCRRDRRDRVVRRRRRRPGGARRDRRGQVRRQPERASRAVRPRHRQPHGRGLHAPQRRADVGVRRARPPGGRSGTAAPRALGLLLPGGCDLRRPGGWARAAGRRRGAPRRRRSARRRAARRGPRGRGCRFRPVRRRRSGGVRSPPALAQPPLLGRPAGLSRGARGDRVGGGSRRCLGAPARRDRRPPPAAGTQGRGRPRGPLRRRGASPRRRHDRLDRRARALLPPSAGLPRPGGGRSARLGRRRLRQARLRRLARSLSPRAGRAPMASSISSSFRCTRPTARPTRVSRR